MVLAEPESPDDIEDCKVLERRLPNYDKYLNKYLEINQEDVDFI